MSYRNTARASTRFRAHDASAIPQTLTPPAVLRFESLDVLDIRFREFLRHAQLALKHSADSRRGYKGAYGNFRTFLLIDSRALPEKLCDIEAWVAWNEGRTKADGTKLSGVSVNTYYRLLRPFFDDLEARDGLPNPFRGSRPPKIPRGLPKARSAQECEQILRTAEHAQWESQFERWRAVAILATFLYAGLRKGELLRLGFNDVNLSEGEILVKDQKTNDERIVPIHPELYPVLHRYRKEREAVFGKDAGAGFFTSLATAQGISDSTLRRIVTRVRRTSGIPFSMHSLRHSFVTTFLNSDGQMHVVQAAAGHKRITTTARYARVRKEDLHREMQKLSFRARAATRR
jgi:site-specific recombinase XerD